MPALTLHARARWPPSAMSMLTCPVFQAVWQWFASIWTAIAPPVSRSAIAACCGSLHHPVVFHVRFPGLPCSESIPAFIPAGPAVVAFRFGSQVKVSHRRSHLLGEVHLGSYSCLSAAIVSSYPLCISLCGELCTLHRSPDRPLLLRFRGGRFGTDLLHPAFHNRWGSNAQKKGWVQLLAWTVA